jgi:hypothetical protein
MMPGGYLEEALYGAYVGMVTVDRPPLSDRDKQRFFGLENPPRDKSLMRKEIILFV